MTISLFLFKTKLQHKKLKNLIENYFLRTRNVLKTFHEDYQVVVEVTGSRKLENGLVIPGTFKAVTRSRRLGAKFYEELNKVKQLCAHMDISIKEMRSKPVRL